MDNNKIPVVGDGATMGVGSDRTACTIIKISKSGKTIWIQEDACLNLGGASDQQWEISRDENGEIHRVSLRDNGQWRRSGANGLVKIGVRHHYYDFDF